MYFVSWNDDKIMRKNLPSTLVPSRPKKTGHSEMPPLTKPPMEKTILLFKCIFYMLSKPISIPPNIYLSRSFSPHWSIPTPLNSPMNFGIEISLKVAMGHQVLPIGYPWGANLEGVFRIRSRISYKRKTISHIKQCIPLVI